MAFQLLAESSGDAEDYEQKVRDAKRIILLMTERDMTTLKKVADDELQAAMEGNASSVFATSQIHFIDVFLGLVLGRVDESFTNPARNVSARVESLLAKFSSIHAKLHELRSHMNNATALANNASTTNAVNRRNLADTKARIESNIAYDIFRH